MSITFDPFMTLSLPIPGKKEKFSFFFIPYNIAPEYCNFKGEVFMRESETILDFRNLIAKKFNRDVSSFLVTTVLDNVVKKIVD